MGNINYNDKFDIGIVSPSYKIFSIADGYDKRFVAVILKAHRALYNYMLVSEQGASVVRRNLNMEAFEQLVFKMPPIDKQREIGNAISALQSRLELAVRVKTAYEKQKQWLLTEMFIQTFWRVRNPFDVAMSVELYSLSQFSFLLLLRT